MEYSWTKGESYCEAWGMLAEVVAQHEALERERDTESGLLSGR
jgi:hypothetical protein